MLREAGTKVTAKGMDELLKNLSILPAKIQRNVLRGAVRKAATVLLKEARTRVPVDENILKRSLAVVQHKRNPNEPNIIAFSIGPNSRKIHKLQAMHYIVKKWMISKKTGHRYSTHYNYGGHIELGNSKMPAQPYLRPAFESKGDESIEVVKDYMRKRLDKELSK